MIMVHEVLQEDQSCWVNLLPKQKIQQLIQVMTNFLFLCNHDLSYFINQEKLQGCILKITSYNTSLPWDLLDTTREKVVKHIVKDKDKGIAKEWEPFGWYCQPSKEDIEKGTEGELLWKLIFWYK